MLAEGGGNPGMPGSPGLPGLPDLPRLARWLASDAGPGRGELLGAELIPGGRSNLTYRLDLTGGPVVLRRPPLGRLLPTANDVSREFGVLSALADTGVPVPVPIAMHVADDLIGAPFYLMAYVDGMVLRTRRDGQQLTGGQAGQLSAAIAAMLARIHAVNTSSAGLSRFGKPDGYLGRQLARWQRQWELSATRAVPGYERLLERLAAGLPASSEATLVHGDFRLDNTLVTLGDPLGDRADREPRIAAVVDWEMATRGDPLADLGLTLTYWADPADPDWGQVNHGASVTTLPGFWSAEQVAASYASLAGRDVSRIRYYIAFGCFKLAVVLEGIHARFLRRQTVGEGFEREGPAVPVLINRAHRMLDGG